MDLRVVAAERAQKRERRSSLKHVEEGFRSLLAWFVSQPRAPDEKTTVATRIHEAEVFVQMADGAGAPRAMCTSVQLAGQDIVLRFDHEDTEPIVLVRDGRYEFPLLEARAGAHWELTLAAPWGERILLQFGRAGTQTAPPPEEGDEAVAAF
jgi:hypothetical protein